MTQSELEDTEHGGMPLRRKRVLIADDDVVAREAIGEVLVEDGDDVIGVENGMQVLECMEIMQRDRLRVPDLIVMDVCMPGGSGVDVLEELRRAGWTTPVVLMTAFASADARARARQVGWAIVIEKPFTLDDLWMAADFARRRCRAPDTRVPV